MYSWYILEEEGVGWVGGGGGEGLSDLYTPPLGDLETQEEWEGEKLGTCRVLVI